MIEVTPIDERTTVYSSTEHSVVATESSGETSLFSPDGSVFGLLANENWYVVEGVDVKPLDAVYQLQWHHDKPWFVEHDRWRNIIIYWDGNGHAAAPFHLVPPLGSSYGRQQEVTSGKRYQSVVWRFDDVSSPRRWLTFFDEEGVKHQWEFTRDIHGGDAIKNTWHEMFAADIWLVFNLSSNSRDERMPHYRCRYNGFHWGPIVFDDGGPLHRSHLTCDGDLMASGWWDGSTPVISVNRIEDGKLVATLPNRIYGHGCLRGSRLIYSGYDLALRDDTAVRIWDLASGTDDLVAAIEPQPSGPRVWRRARPVINRQGTMALWHEVRDGRTVVLSKRLTQAEPPPPDNKLLERAKAIDSMVRSLRAQTAALVTDLEER